MQVYQQIIDTGWRVRELAPSDDGRVFSKFDRLSWLPAQIPGHVHLDLMRAGVIPDPFARMCERGVAWVSDTDWEYETTFQVSAPLQDNVYLVFHGLDTLAEVSLNGDVLGQTQNMFVPHEFLVSEKLKEGDNTLSIVFRSALRIGKERLDKWNSDPSQNTDYEFDQATWAARSFVRKAQYMFGWDWGPILPSAGIWRPVELVTVSVARLLDWKYDVEFKSSEAKVTITAEVERSPTALDTPLEICAAVLAVGTLDSDFDDILPDVSSAQVGVGSRKQSVTVELTIDDPRWWNPVGQSSARDDSEYPVLYSLELSLTDGDTVVDVKEAKIGLRTIELICEPDPDGQGEGFKFRVNGADLFAKGANWIPEDSFPSRLENEAGRLEFPIDDRVRQRVEDAARAGMNMLRVWGGGLYESEHFYEACDSYGLLVWQDFPYACAYYPDTGEYAAESKREAQIAVRRIRNHASIALWCGNNENLQMFQDKWGGKRPQRYLGEHLYNEILPAVVAAEDSKTPYWPSSPAGGQSAQSSDYGDCHNWDVWHGRGDWKFYTQNSGRFCSEFGFAASPGLQAWNGVLDTDDCWSRSPAVRWHDKTNKGYDTYLAYVALHFPCPYSLEDLVYYSQVNQAEALKYGVEHYRRNKGRNWGTLFWQLNDCWPVQSWAVIDSTGEPKAAYYASKRFYAPVLISLTESEYVVTAHAISDLSHGITGTLGIALKTFDGELLSESTHRVQLAANSAQIVATFDASAARSKKGRVYVTATLSREATAEPHRNFLFFAEPKDLELSSPGITFDVAQKGDGYLITLKSSRFAPYVWLRRSDDHPLFEPTVTRDNFFHMEPGETRELIVAISDDLPTVESLRGRLLIRSL